MCLYRVSTLRHRRQWESGYNVDFKPINISSSTKWGIALKRHDRWEFIDSFTLQLGDNKLIMSWQVPLCSVLKWINTQKEKIPQAWEETGIKSLTTASCAKQLACMKSVRARCLRSESLLSASLSHHLADYPHQGQCDSSRTFYSPTHY